MNENEKNMIEEEKTVDPIRGGEMKKKRHTFKASKLSFIYDRSNEGGRKSFRFEEIDPAYRINSKSGVPVHFLEALQKDLDSRC